MHDRLGGTRFPNAFLYKQTNEINLQLYIIDVKSALSSNDMYLLSGSSDNNAYIWKVSNPTDPPIVLKGHLGEVTSVAWCPSDQGKVCLIPTSRAVCPVALGQGCH